MRVISFYLKLLACSVWVLFTSSIFLIVAILSKNRSAIFAKTVNFLARGIMPILGIKLAVEGRENLISHQPCIFIGNHQSALDVAIYGELCPPNTVAIGKKEIALIPLFGWLFKYSGGILIDRKNRKRALSQIDDAVVAVRDRGLSVGILPEGTRNRTGKGLLPFKKGAFHLAVSAQAPLVPIVISEMAEIVNMENKILRSGTIAVRVLEPIETRGLDETQVDELVHKCHQLILKNLTQIKSKPVI